MGDIPPWLNVMRTLTGTKEVSGSGANPVITGMADEIGRRYSDQAWYADQSAWDSDETAWCGMAAAYCCAMSDLVPPFKQKPADDTERWGWAQSFASDDNFVEINAPVPGAIVVMKRSGGGHVTFYERDAGSNIICRGGNQSNSVNEASFPKSDVIAYVWPRGYPLPDLPPVPRDTVEKGDTGPTVEVVQTILGIVPADGDFGPITEGGVKGFQRATGLSADGIVGPDTWDELDVLEQRKTGGPAPLSPTLVGAICDLVKDADISVYSWRDRGVMPLGYTQGVACCFALAQQWLAEGDPAAIRMARANTGNRDKDVLAWYGDQFAALHMDNTEDGIDTLRHLFALMLGLGPRESSGRYCEGRDMSASNVQADTAEAGMFQTSWNIRSSDSAIGPLLPEFWLNPNGFLEQFQNGVQPDANDLDGYGTGDGAKYQFLSKYCPAFHAFVTALGMRSLRQHWGPINRNEVELRADADELLLAVQSIVESGVVPPEPPIDDVVPTVTITIDPPGSARVVIIGATQQTLKFEA